MPGSENIYSFSVKKPDGLSQAMSDFKGKVLLIVNVASRCGFTPQYSGLGTLARTYHERGLVVIGFPCNQFGGQEPGSNDEIQTFCKLNYKVDFPIMAKIDVNGDKADPVYEWLKSHAPGILGTEAIKWNFTKFLVGRDGRVIARYAPQTDPSSIAKDIETALKASVNE